MTSYPSLQLPSRNDRVLIVAPHMDDEIIGAGGYAVDALSCGAEVFVVFLTAGDCSRLAAHVLHRTFDPTADHFLSVGRTRIAEARLTMERLGIDREHYFVLGYPDRGLRELLNRREEVIASPSTHRTSVPYDEAFSPGADYHFDNMLTDLRRVMDATRPTTVIAPVGFDRHPDHGAAAEFTQLALAGRAEQPSCLGYLVHSSLIKPPFRSSARALVPPSRLRMLRWGTHRLTSAVLRRKEALLELYRSQGLYVSLLRNPFLRANELFLLGEQLGDLAVPAGVPPTAARIAIAR
ncbi:MAG TPA: PIG-L family deacetylase [Thermoanaerobaculia bacterium]|nr:PIG-L family deacetylase [Thermoanaerobaculia bacterium]